MPFVTPTIPAVGDPTEQSLVQTIIDDLVFLNSQVGGGPSDSGDLLLNGSFEVDADATDS